jgi:raffinose/stachyose/melibiose transport system substrate-binding protein
MWESFERANPDIKIIREDLFNEHFHNRLDAYIAADQLPDVVFAWPSGRSASLHARRLLKDLTPLLKRDHLTASYRVLAPDGAHEGGYVGVLPLALTLSHVFYVNTAVLRACGLRPARTYEELKAQVPVLRAKGYDTVLISQKDAWVMQSCLFSMVAGRFCGEDWEKRILSGRAKFTDGDFVAALDFIKTLYTDGVISKMTLTIDYNSMAEQFAAGRGAYLVDGNWRIASFITNGPTGQALIPPEKQNNIQIAFFPDIPGTRLNQSTSITLSGGWGISARIPPGSPKEEAAWRLVKWLSGREVQTRLLETGGIIVPTRTDIDIESLRLEPIQKTASSLGARYTAATAVIDAAFHSDVYTVINDGLQMIGLGTRTPRQAAQAAQQALDDWMAERK